MGADVGEGGVDFLRLPVDDAGKLPSGVAQGLVTLRVDKIRHRLRLGQAQPAVEQDALQKLKEGNMGVTIMMDVTKADVENLSQELEVTKNEGLQDFIERVLQATDEFTKYMLHDAMEVAKVNPYSMG